MVGAQGWKPSFRAACRGTYAPETSYANRFPQLMLRATTLLQTSTNECNRPGEHECDSASDRFDALKAATSRAERPRTILIRESQIERVLTWARFVSEKRSINGPPRPTRPGSRCRGR